MITILVRTALLYFLIMAGLRLMGKRQIGQLEPSELVLTMMISDLAAVPMQDFGIPLLAGVFPILTLLALSMLMSELSLKNLRFRRLVCGLPAVLIRNGQVQQKAMKANRYTLDELLEQLRGQGLSGIQDVKYAVLENSGQLSVLPEGGSLPTVLINDGQVLSQNLRRRGKNTVWLKEVLSNRGLTHPKQVFLLTLDEMEQVFCIEKEDA